MQNLNASTSSNTEALSNMIIFNMLIKKKKERVSLFNFQSCVIGLLHPSHSDLYLASAYVNAYVKTDKLKHLGGLTAALLS